jgi:hypothetical protein
MSKEKMNMTQITFASGQYPKRMTGTIKFNAGGSGTYTIGESVTGSGFSARVIKWDATNYKLTVKEVSGTPSGVITGGSSGAAWTVATVNSVTSGGIAVKTGGWNLRETNHGITRSKVIGGRVLAEVLLASANLLSKRTDFATIPAFTLTAFTSTGPYDVSDGDLITFTITSSEAIEVVGAPTYAITVGANGRTATYSDIDSGGTVMTFQYAVTADDIAGPITLTLADGDFTFPAGAAFLDKASGSVLAMTGTVSATGGPVTQGTVTIQA